MKIYVTVKLAGKRKGVLTKKEFVLHNNPTTLRELITEIIQVNVNEYYSKQEETSLIPYLSHNELEGQADTGRIGFNRIYNDGQVMIDEAIKNGIVSYKDGLFKVFHGETELLQLDDQIDVQSEDVFTFIRLTMLTGRMI
ncbi:hypothetical protein ACERII_10600 [Evansella sp. AB-rgal1]|uniref:hypothetical protein n=1 Tax=Evansella sp. AB-rgal1 TaxID=3242696 RepID=UPI00359EC871